MDNNELMHHGVKGMKWGVIRWRKARKEKKARAERVEKMRQGKIAAAERRKKVASGKIKSKNMTTEELQDRIKRLEMEKQYNSLLGEQKKAHMTRGKKFIDKFLDSTLDKTADNALADVVAQTLKTFTVKAVNELLGEEVVFTNNKKK